MARCQQLVACGLLAVALLTLNASASNSVKYDGYKVLRITPQSEQHVDDLMTFLKRSEYDVWRPSRHPGDAADVMVSPDKVAFFTDSLQGLGFDTSVMIDDVQELIEGSSNFGLVDEPESANFNWTQYYTIEGINTWLKEIAQTQNKIATLITAGKTEEGRELVGLRIAHGPNLPIVFVEAGIHAREWISPATATWFIKEVLEGKNETLNAYEWHVFPSVNPDGYAYTQKDRLWRKNRRKNPGSNSCLGVDLNRNWPYKWEGGANTCSETFPGAAGGSEPELKGLISYLNTILNRTRVYISLHSYSQLLMYPWGYTSNPTQKEARFNEIAKKAVTQLKSRYGTSYRYGAIAKTIYTAAGNSIDYAFSVNITNPFVFELRDTGLYGFVLPPEYIIPTATETTDALVVILKEALKN